MLDIKTTLKHYISNELLEDDLMLEDHESLLAEGMVDSLGMLRLVGFIEDTYAIKVPPEDFTIENFRTLAVLDNYLSRAINDAGGNRDNG